MPAVTPHCQRCDRRQPIRHVAPTFFMMNNPPLPCDQPLLTPALADLVFVRPNPTPRIMHYPKETSTSLHEYSDNSIPHAAYAAIVYAVLSTLNISLAWFRATPTPWIGIVIVTFVVGFLFAGLAFGILCKSRIAVVIMLVLVMGLQLYTWLVMRSAFGTILSIIVTGFLLRGARRIFQCHAESETDAQKV